MSRRRGAGVAAIKKKQAQREKFKEIGEDLQENRLQHSREVLETFKSQLEEFAQKYKKDIKSDPQFRRNFQEMCAQIGVDPLASNKGFWAEVLGIGSFYYELGVQIIDICIQTRPSNGGIISMTEVLSRLQRKAGKSRQQACEDDVRRAVSKVKVLGSGFGLLDVGSTTMIVSVPVELNHDHSSVLALAQSSRGSVTIAALTQGELGWSQDRAERALDKLLAEGMVWVDDYAGTRTYMLLSIWFEQRLQEGEHVDLSDGFEGPI